MRRRPEWDLLYGSLSAAKVQTVGGQKRKEQLDNCICRWNKTIKIVCKYLFYMLVTRKEKHLGNETMKQWYETIQNVAINQIKIECFTGAWEDRKATENLSIVWASLLNTNACGGSWGCSSSVATLPFWPPTWETQAKQWRFEHLVSHQRARVSHSRGKRSQRRLLRIHHS